MNFYLPKVHNEVKDLQLNKKKIAVLFGLTLLFISAIIFAWISINKKNNTRLTLSHLINNPIDNAKLETTSTYNNLPVGNVENFPVKNAIGTVIFIPQIHQDPSTNISDKGNNTAVTAQDQIYTIEKFLTTHAKYSLIFTEGEIYGQVPPYEITYLSKEISLRNDVVSKLQTLEEEFKKNPINPIEETQVISQVQQEIATVDRQITLTGAAQKLKVNNTNLMLYGIEDEATLEESKPLVRDYVYIQDRINQLEASSTNAASTSQNTPNQMTNSAASLIQLLMQSGGFNLSNNTFSNLEAKTNNSSIKQQIQSLQTEFQSLEQVAQTPVPTSQNDAVATSTTPTREDNPYTGINNVAQLKNMLTTAENNLTKVVVDKRNLEIADNIKDGMQNNHQGNAILQLGAGHEEGIVKDLNNNGLSVIVVTPSIVLTNALAN